MKVNKKLVVPESNIFTLVLDILLVPFMWILGGFTKPLQETHIWHIKNIDSRLLNVRKGAYVKSYNLDAKFDHSSSPLFHMPIFGGLTKYVAFEVKGYKDHWHVIWIGQASDRPDLRYAQIHTLRIKNPGLKLLAGRAGYTVYAVDDFGNFLDVKIIGEGELGDNKFSGLRLF